MLQTTTLEQLREQVQTIICGLIPHETDEKDCNIRKCIESLYDAREALFYEIEKGESGRDITKMTPADIQMAREIMGEIGGEYRQRVASMIESLNGCFGTDDGKFTENNLKQLGLGVII